MPLFKVAFICAGLLVIPLGVIQVIMRRQAHDAIYGVGSPETRPWDERYLNSIFGEHGIRNAHKKTYERSALRLLFTLVAAAWLVALVLAVVALGATKQDTKPATSQTTSHKTPYVCNFARVHHLINSSDHLAVRSGPGLHFPKVDRLEIGKPVYICDERGDWLRIFYGDKNSPCGTASPGGVLMCARVRHAGLVG